MLPQSVTAVSHHPHARLANRFPLVVPWPHRSSTKPNKKTELIIIKFFICFRWPRTRLANSSPIVLSLGRGKKQTPLGRPLLGLTSLATDNYVPSPSSTAKFVRPSTLKRFARAHSQRRGHKKASLCTPATVHTPRTTKWLPALRAFATASARTSLKSILLYSDLILMARTADRSLNGFFGEACSEIFAGSHDLSAHYQTRTEGFAGRPPEYLSSTKGWRFFDWW